MSAEVVSGQLYRVGYTGSTEGEVVAVDCLVIAASIEDAKRRLPYLVDLSDYSSYRIDYVAKEPGRVYTIKRRCERVETENPDAVIKRDGGSQSVWQAIAPATGRKWEVFAKTTCFAKSAQAAQRKLADRLAGGSSSVSCEVSELSVASGYATAKDVSMFQRASFVRG